MAQEAEIVRHIEDKRREVAEDLNALEELVRERSAMVMDPLRHLRARPLAVVGSGLILGFVLGWTFAR